jgi:hypothetical protein
MVYHKTACESLPQNEHLDVRNMLEDTIIGIMCSFCRFLLHRKICGLFPASETTHPKPYSRVKDLKLDDLENLIELSRNVGLKNCKLRCVKSQMSEGLIIHYMDVVHELSLRKGLFNI